MKKIIAILLSVLTAFSLSAIAPASAEEVSGAPTGFTAENALYAHAVKSNADGDAWQGWQALTVEGEFVEEDYVRYFFLPTSADEESVDIYNAFSSAVTVNGTEIASKSTANVRYSIGEDYKVSVNSQTYTLRFMKSHAEAAIYINNPNADGNGTELMPYLYQNKSFSAKATGAIVTPDGAVDNTPIKKIKGRGNTTWQKPKKAFNITYDSKVSIAGMNSGKKYSILANYQDDSLSRNRFLYDLSDAVGMPYASDSRYVDFYSNGLYLGSYQMTEKVEVGKNTLIPDFEEEDYLDADGNVKEDFPFLCEVDAGATEGEDYFVTLNDRTKITIKAPELEEGDKGYDEVKAYVKEKFQNFHNTASSRTADLSNVADVESLANIYLINELGKNWDSGVSSLFFTYKQDENGVYKFYGSPVWDYDNSLGNAVGVEGDLKNMGVTDYEEYTGWWCMYKGKSKSQKSSTNIINRFAQNSNIKEISKKLWFERYVPAIEHFAGRKLDEKVNEDFYTADAYYSLIKDSAAMNYTGGWLLNTGSWIADHSSLKTAYYSSEDNTYYYNSFATKYDFTFEGMYNYCRDWFISRAAWLTKSLSDTKVNEVEVTQQPVTEPASTEPTAPATQPTEEKSDAISALKVTLSATKFVYTGKAINPTVTVTAGSVKLSNDMFDITYSSGRKNVGKYSVSVSIKGGSAKKTVSFTIVPKSTALKVTKRAKTTAKLKWSKTSQTTGYQIYYSTKKSFSSKKSRTVKSKTSVKLTKLKKSKVYYAKIRSYKTVGGKKYYSAWSKKVKISKYKK